MTFLTHFAEYHINCRSQYYYGIVIFAIGQKAQVGIAYGNVIFAIGQKAQVGMELAD